MTKCDDGSSSRTRTDGPNHRTSGNPNCKDCLGVDLGRGRDKTGYSASPTPRSGAEHQSLCQEPPSRDTHGHGDGEGVTAAVEVPPSVQLRKAKRTVQGFSGYLTALPLSTDSKLLDDDLVEARVALLSLNGQGSMECRRKSDP